MQRNRIGTQGLLVAVILAMGISQSLWAQRVLPEPTIVESPLRSVEDSIVRHFVSHGFEFNDPRVKPGANLLDVETQGIRDFVEGTGEMSHLAGIPASRKGLFNIRYSVSSPKIAESFRIAKAAGFRHAFHVTDANTFIDYPFGPEEKSSSDFLKGKIRSGEAGDFVSSLLGYGFEFNHPRFGILTPPVLNKELLGIIDIMHEKGLLLIVYGEDDSIQEIYTYDGTANQAGGQRFNRITQTSPKDRQTTQYMLDHALRLQKGFAEGKAIKEVESVPPLRVVYADGSFQEIAYTDGKFNPNSRIAALFDRATQSPNDIQVKEIIFSHFVFTNMKVFQALKALMLAQSHFEVLGVFDDKFIGADGHGVVAALVGYLVDREYGPHVWALPAHLRRRMKLMGYQRQAVDSQGQPIPEKDPEGPPTDRHVWHDKTTIVNVIEKGEAWTYIFTGSFNNSNHYQNAESQKMIRVRTDSWVAQSFIQSVKGPMATESEFMVPLGEAVFRKSLGTFIGHSLFQIPRAESEHLRADIAAGRFEEALGHIRDLAAKPSTLNANYRITPEELEHNITRITQFLDFYQRLEGFNHLTTEQIVALGLMILESDRVKTRIEEEAREIVDILKFTIWKPGLSEADQLRLIQQAWDKLDIKLPRPVVLLKLTQNIKPCLDKTIRPCLNIVGDAVALVNN